jgi:hypothetical protein
MLAAGTPIGSAGTLGRPAINGLADLVNTSSALIVEQEHQEQAQNEHLENNLRSRGRFVSSRDAPLLPIVRHVVPTLRLSRRIDNPLAMLHAEKVQGACRDRRPGFPGNVH